MAEAEAADYHHPNCRHSENLYIPGGQLKTHQENYKSTKQAADNRDQQRYMERTIRKYKAKAEFDPKYESKVRE